MLSLFLIRLIVRLLLSSILLLVICLLLPLSFLFLSLFFFLMIRRPPRSTLDRSSAASDVYKRQVLCRLYRYILLLYAWHLCLHKAHRYSYKRVSSTPVSYTHLRAHETVLDLVCRLLLEKKKHEHINTILIITYNKNIYTTTTK